MALLRIDLDPDSLSRLAEIAVKERRPIILQAEVLLLKAIGRWPVPYYPMTTDRRQEHDGDAS
jgi:hypothetical protein